MIAQSDMEVGLLFFAIAGRAMHSRGCDWCPGEGLIVFASHSAYSCSA